VTVLGLSAFGLKVSFINEPTNLAVQHKNAYIRGDKAIKHAMQTLAPQNINAPYFTDEKKAAQT